MKYHQILSILREQPLLITPEAHASLLALFDEHRTLSAAEFNAKREGTGACGETIELEQMLIEDGIAQTPIGGPIGRGLGSFEKGAGAVDVADIEDDLNVAEEDEECRVILLNFDSPGGMVSGTPELADRIAAVQKPIYSFTPGLMCSAAYWLAAASDGIFATKSANIGSIGVYMPFADYTEMAKQKGIKIRVFSSGKYKGMGVPGTSLTKDQETLLQEEVMKIAGMFYEHVQANRPDVPDDAMQGQAFMGAEALEMGLIDNLVRDRSEMLGLI